MPDPELVQLLAEEVDRHRNELGAPTAAVEDWRRALHALRGASALAGIPVAAEHLRRLEHVLQADPQAARERAGTFLSELSSELATAIRSGSFEVKLARAPWPIRRADSREIARLVELNQQAFPQERSGVEERHRRFQEELSRPFANVLVAEDCNGRIVGYVAAWKSGEEVHILDLATERAVRRRGVASALLEALIERARSERTQLIVLEVRRSNEGATRVYEKHGFRLSRVRRGYYPDGEDGIELFLPLSDSAC